MQNMKRSYKSTRMTFIFAILGTNHRVKLGDGAAQLHKFRPRSHSSCRARPTDPFPGLSPPPNFKFLARAQKGSGNETSNHYYCSTCIEKMAARSRGGPFDCPECRKETSLPAGGVAGLQPAFFVERIKDLHGKMARAEGKVEALCEQCAGEKSVAFCRQCAEFICGDCSRSHTKMKVFSGHVVASLEDLKKGGVKNIPLKESPAAACADHGEPKILFCFDCEQDGGGRETPSTAVTGANSHCRHRLPPSLS